jgi:hypothetical protein
MLVCAEALGPVRFAGWDHDSKPLGRPVQAPYIPVVATEEMQSGHVYGAVEFMLREGAVSGTPGLDVGQTRTFLPDGGKIQPITAKAVSKEGGRESFAAFDESHLFITRSSTGCTTPSGATWRSGRSPSPGASRLRRCIHPVRTRSPSSRTRTRQR